MGKYRYLLWDLDGTILDFLAAEKAAIKDLFTRFSLGECSDEMVETYSKINVKYWEALERNEMTKPEILVGRFCEFFETVGIDPDFAAEFNDAYQLALGDHISFQPGVLEALDQCKDKYVLAAVTNGTKAAQDKKLAESGLDKVFEYIFISEEIGIEKPNLGFFDKAFEVMGITEEDKTSCLIIGDSLTSDMRGGNNAGIDTCWYNPSGEINEGVAKVDYEIRGFAELLEII